MDTKPNPILRTEVLKDDIIILPSDRIKRMHHKNLQKAEEYYESILVSLCGTQIWSILEALTAVQEEIKSRKHPQPSLEDTLIDTILKETNAERAH